MKHNNIQMYLIALLLDSSLFFGLNLAYDPSENELDSHESHNLKSSPVSVLHDEVDMLKLMDVSAKDPGISLVEGPVPNHPAYKFRQTYENSPINNSSTVTAAMNSDGGFTVLFLYRQQKNNPGTLLSVNTPGRLTPWFQLNSNAKTGYVTLKYRMGVKLRQLEWRLPKHHRKSPMAAWIWLSLSVDFNTGIVRLDLDCEPSRFESLQLAKNAAHIKIPQDSLVYFRQEPGRKKKFLGSMQVAKVLPYVPEHRLWNCVEISSKLAPELRKPLL